jgi:membrane-associated phospholipid phosphatase
MTVDFLVRLLADALVVPIVLIGTFVLLKYVPKGNRFRAYSRILMAGLTALLLAKLAAATWQPEGARPFIEQGLAPRAAYLDNPGFPSDHVLFAMAITLAVYFETSKRRIAVALLVMTLMVGIGRILALVHTPVDVLGGLVFASLGALWYLTNPDRNRSIK